MPSQFQPTILRPPHADELAVVGTIREQNPRLDFENGIPNFGYYRDDDDELLPPVSSVTHPASSSTSPPVNWIELRPPLTSNSLIRTSQLSPSEYEIRSYPTTDEYLHSQQSPPPHPTIIDFRRYSDGYDDEEIDDDLANFQFHSLRRSDMIHSPMKRTDTSTDTSVANNPALIPKSILKGSVSATPPPLDTYPMNYSQMHHSRTSSKFDESPHTSVKINTDESIPIDYPTSAIEKFIPNRSISSSNIPTKISPPISLKPMRFASVSHLNEIEWEVPGEFRTVVYDLTAQENQPYRGGLLYSSNKNLNNNNNNNHSNASNNDPLSNRRRSQSAGVDQRTHVSRIFVPWDQDKRIIQPFFLTNGIEQGDTTQQQAFEY